MPTTLTTQRTDTAARDHAGSAPLRADRVELLVVPAVALDDAGRRAAAAHLGTGFARPVTLSVQVRDTVLIAVIEERPGVTDPGTRTALELIERDWPEPLGLRLACTSDEWSVESDTLGVRPLYVARDVARGLTLSTSLTLLAGLRAAAPDPVALAELLAVGFTLGSRTPFTGVERLRPGARVVATADRGVRIETVPEPEPARTDGTHDPPWIDALGAVVTRAFVGGAALELSGGADSRLVLALGLAHGTPPRFAFTLGADDDEDVAIARALCRAHGIEHVALPVACAPTTLADDARAFVTLAGFGVSATSSGWLPAALRPLDARRSVQVAGGGGECATGFYDTPLDELTTTGPGLHAWIVHRLLRPGMRLDDYFVRDRARELRRTTVDAAHAALDETTGAFRDRTAALYRRHRVTNAGGPVLAARAAAYRPLSPLLHAAYLDWGRALTPAARAGRRAQLAALARLCPDLALAPLSGGRRPGPSRAAVALRRGARIAARLAGRPRPADLGAAGAAVALAALPAVRASVAALSEHPALALRPESVERLLAAPASRPHALGMLITTAWGLEECAAVGRALRVDA